MQRGSFPAPVLKMHAMQATVLRSCLDRSSATMLSFRDASFSEGKLQRLEPKAKPMTQACTSQAGCRMLCGVFAVSGLLGGHIFSLVTKTTTQKQNNTNSLKLETNNTRKTNKNKNIKHENQTTLLANITRKHTRIAGKTPFS